MTGIIRHCRLPECGREFRVQSEKPRRRYCLPACQARAKGVRAWRRAQKAAARAARQAAKKASA